MKNKKTYWNRAVMLLFSVALITGCTPSLSLLNQIPTHSMNVKVVDSEGNPIAGAQVSASNGKDNSTNEKGIAKIRFGTVGIYNIWVEADNYMPSSFTITMPKADGKTFTRRLSEVPDYSNLSFGMANFYPFLYNYMFSGFGYSLVMQPYRESEYTVWEMTLPDTDDAITMKKAFLKTNGKNQQWWHLTINMNDEDHSKYAAEMLFSKDRSHILRYRDQIDDEDIQEKPVTKDWYSKPIELTKESVEGATIKKGISVETPAGTFTASLVKFGPAPGTTLKIWRNNQVPGGVVKYEILSDNEVVMSSVLKKYGNGAKTTLKSY